MEKHSSPQVRFLAFSPVFLLKGTGDIKGLKLDFSKESSHPSKDQRGTERELGLPGRARGTPACLAHRVEFCSPRPSFPGRLSPQNTAESGATQGASPGSGSGSGSGLCPLNGGQCSGLSSGPWALIRSLFGTCELPEGRLRKHFSGRANATSHVPAQQRCLGSTQSLCDWNVTFLPGQTGITIQPFSITAVLLSN